jgi:hypothetical protein
VNPFFATADKPQICRILILRPGALGDTLLTFPALALLRRYFPLATIEIIGNRPVLRLALEWGLADGVDAFGADWVGDLFGDAPTPALRERLQRYDLGIVWMHSTDAAADLARRLEAAGVRRTVPLISFPAAGSYRHVADHLVDTLAAHGISEPGALAASGFSLGELWASGNPSDKDVLTPSLRSGPAGPRFGADFLRMRTLNSLSPRERVRVREAKGVHAQPSDRRLAVLHPGAGARRKRWPAEQYAALGGRLIGRGYALAVTSGPADEDAVAALRASLDQPIELLADLELRDLAPILARASLVVGNDSGITHLAALCGAPTVAILGPFHLSYWAPLGPRVAVVDAGRDCTHRQDPRDGCRQCDPLPSLAVDTVWAAVQSLLDPSNAN